jgi:hypothetical protein
MAKSEIILPGDGNSRARALTVIYGGEGITKGVSLWNGQCRGEISNVLTGKKARVDAHKDTMCKDSGADESRGTRKQKERERDALESGPTLGSEDSSAATLPNDCNNVFEYNLN